MLKCISNSSIAVHPLHSKQDWFGHAVLTVVAFDQAQLVFSRVRPRNVVLFASAGLARGARF